MSEPIIDLSTILQFLILCAQTGILVVHAYLFNKQKEEAATMRKSGNFFALLQYLENTKFNDNYLTVAKQILETKDTRNHLVDENALKNALQQAEVAAECYNNKSVEKELFEKIVYKKLCVLCKWVFDDDPKSKHSGHIKNMKLFYSSLHTFWQNNRDKNIVFGGKFEFDDNGKLC